MNGASTARCWSGGGPAQPGEPGGNTWNDAPAQERTGAGIWGTPTYDPELGLLFIGTANSYNLQVLMRSSGHHGVNGDGLYTDTTLAIDPDNGKVVWTFQHLPHDVWNMDWAFERVVVTLGKGASARRAGRCAAPRIDALRR